MNKSQERRCVFFFEKVFSVWLTNGGSVLFSVTAQGADSGERGRAGRGARCCCASHLTPALCGPSAWPALITSAQPSSPPSEGRGACREQEGVPLPCAAEPGTTAHPPGPRTSWCERLCAPWALTTPTALLRGPVLTRRRGGEHPYLLGFTSLSSPPLPVCSQFRSVSDERVCVG